MEKWFKIEEIPRCNYMMVLPILVNYGTWISRRGGGKYFNKVLWLYEKGTATLCYIREDFDRGLQFLIDKTISDPGWAERQNQEIVKYSERYYDFAKKIENKNFSAMSNRQLADVFDRLIACQNDSHHSGQATTWLIDADKELFTRHLLRILDNKKISSVPEVFTVLTTPDKPSFVERESQDSLKILLAIEEDRAAKKLFLSREMRWLKDNLGALKPALNKKIMNHYHKYLWLYYNYEGPILELEYFLEIWQGLLKQGNFKKLLKKSENKFVETKKERGALFKKLNLDRTEKRLFNVAQDIVWLKGWRKDCMYFGSYVLDKILNEIKNRLSLTLKQVRHLCFWEVRDALIKNDYNLDELNKRFSSSVLFTDSVKKPRVYAGPAARKFLDKLSFIKQELKQTDVFKGTCACPGKGRGRVTIVETVDDIKKMKKGDVMLSETTYPALVPAMKLASAIVTNVGGLTCHAAIVSRELKIPCVVGTKIATKVLKDGDMVEVNANDGIVKKI